VARFDDAEYRQFREWLVQQYGLDFGPERRDILRARLEPTRRELGFEDFHQLLFHLKYHPDREGDRGRLLRHLTNNESYFFREPAQLDVLREEILPALRTRAREQGRPVRLMSAGCASGEEAYTLAMIVDQSPLRLGEEAVVTGVDVDESALARAREGSYRDNAFRRIPPDMRRRYFQSADGTTRIEPRLVENVDFRRANLVDPASWAGIPPQHVIFCRNVLIYFDDSATRRAVRILHDALVPGGYLFLGHAESLSRVPTPLVTERRPGTVFHRRPEG